MAKLDRLGWAEGVAFTTYGLRVGVRVNRAEVLSRLLDCLPFGWKPAATPEVDELYSLIVAGPSPRPNLRLYNLLYAGPFRMARTEQLEEVFPLLESELQLQVAERARRRLFVHAGVVGWRGRALVLPGYSHAGKSTLVAALLRAGASYYSDEYAVLDAQGRVHPYARPLALRDQAGPPTRRCSPEQFGARAGIAPLPVGLVALTEYRPGKRWRPRELSPGQGVLGLLAHTVPARRRPEFALTVLRRAMAGARVMKSARGEADDAAQALLESCDAACRLATVT
jgi:hypothetical protein